MGSPPFLLDFVFNREINYRRRNQFQDIPVVTFLPGGPTPDIGFKRLFYCLCFRNAFTDQHFLSFDCLQSDRSVQPIVRDGIPAMSPSPTFHRENACIYIIYSAPEDSEEISEFSYFRMDLRSNCKAFVALKNMGLEKMW